MSTYTTAKGVLKFGSISALTSAVTMLVEGQWLNCVDGCHTWQDEARKEISNTAAVDKDALTLEIPEHSYRNLDKVMNKLLGLADSGEIKCYSMDDTCRLFLWRNGEITTVDDPTIITNLARTTEEIDFDALTLDLNEWEAKYDESDWSEVCTDVMEAAFRRFG